MVATLHNDRQGSVSSRAARALAELSDAVVHANSVQPGRRPRLLTSVYGPLRRSFSGSTWYCAQAALSEGVLDGAFALDGLGLRDMPLRVRAGFWKLGRKLRRQQTNGYKFTPWFHEAAWRGMDARLSGTILVNNFQLFGRAFLQAHERQNILPCFYIDGTLSEYFHGYGKVEQQTIGNDTIGQAIELEREGYACAARIMTMSQATRTHLMQEYGVAADRIAVIPPGANIDDAAVPSPSLHTGWHGPEFILGFVGLFPLRKGLDKLADAVRILRGRGKPIRLRVIGRCPDEIAAMDGVDFLGAIDKADSAKRFVSAIRTVDLGCQLSRAELLGIALLEFLRVGVPVMATTVGGVPDVLREGGGFLLPPNVTAEAVAEELQALMEDSERYNALRQVAAARSGWASWRRAALQLDSALSSLG